MISVWLARDNPESEAERQQLRRLLPRLNRKLGIASEQHGELTYRLWRSFEVSLDRRERSARWRFCVRDYLAQQEETHSTVHYVENGLINSLFGLLFWDAIFAPIPGAFFHDFQYGPADLESGSILRTSEESICRGLCGARVRSVQGDDSAAIRSESRHSGSVRHLGTTEQAALGVRHSGASRRRTCGSGSNGSCGTSSRIGRAFRTWCNFGRAERYRMVEVKGPGDRLQDNQRRFLEFCTLHHMPVFVCQVRCGSNP